MLYLFIPYTLEDLSTGSFDVGLVGWPRMRETLNIVLSIFHICFLCVLGANFESPLGRIHGSSEAPRCCCFCCCCFGGVLLIPPRI